MNADKDEAHEARIADAMNAYYSTAGQSEAARAEAWSNVCRLISQRTPQRVQQMERERGLAC